MCYAWYHFSFPIIKYFSIHYPITWHCLWRTYPILRHCFLLFCWLRINWKCTANFISCATIWNLGRICTTMKLVSTIVTFAQISQLQEKVEYALEFSHHRIYFTSNKNFLHSNILRISWRTQHTRHSLNNLKRNFITL